MAVVVPSMLAIVPGVANRITASLFYAQSATKRRVVWVKSAAIMDVVPFAPTSVAGHHFLHGHLARPDNVPLLVVFDQTSVMLIFAEVARKASADRVKSAAWLKGAAVSNVPTSVACHHSFQTSRLSSPSTSL